MCTIATDDPEPPSHSKRLSEPIRPVPACGNQLCPCSLPAPSAAAPQVSVTAIQESRVLVWHRDKLKLSIMEDQFLQAVFDNVLGRDVVQKLLQVRPDIEVSECFQVWYFLSLIVGQTIRKGNLNTSYVYIYIYIYIYIYCSIFIFLTHRARQINRDKIVVTPSHVYYPNACVFVVTVPVGCKLRAPRPENVIW